MRIVSVIGWLLLSLLPSAADAQLRIVSYNVANSGQSGSPSTPRAGMDVVLEAIGNEVQQGISKPIDVLLLQESQSSAVTGQAYVNLLNGIYGAGTYARATLEPGTSGGGRTGLVYNTQSVQIIGQLGIANASPRDTARYIVRPIGYEALADFVIYNDHYKAGSSGSDQSTRASHANTVRNNANAFGDAHIIYAGDFNIQSSSETMYQTLLGSGNGQAFDPINRPGNWNNNSSFRGIHTQSPYDTSFNDPSLIAGGMDDRFDFQLVSGEMMDNEGLAYIPGTYRAFGNNGTHSLNDSINDPSNNAQPANVLNALASVSDHLPVVADYQLPAVMQTGGNVSAGRAIVGSTAGATISVWNDASVVAANGADELDYMAVGSGGLSGSFTDSDEALGGVNEHTFLLDTTSVGMQSGMVEVSALGPQTVNPSLNVMVDYQVVNHANASFDAGNDENSLFLDLGIVAPDSVAGTTLAIHNLGAPGLTAALDLLTVNGSLDDDVIGIDLMPFSQLEAGESHDFNVVIDTSESGSFAASYSLLLADEDIPGQLANQQMSLALLASVALPGDANLDGVVDGQDFIAWNNNKFSNGNGWEEGDFTGDGIVDGLDFVVWNNFKFQSLDIAA
ncbi:MAG: endonuclease/exonuclease/phosphatase family protein, partial [Planctomycetota bacterium]